MSEAVALGATCPYDLAVARSDQVQQKLRGFVVPAPQTAGSFLRRFTLGHIGQLNKALRAVHLTAFRLLGVQSGDRVTLDFDSTYVRSYSSRREGADPTWTKRYALHPLLCFVAESSTCLHAKLRRGKAHTSKGIAGFVGECLKRIPRGVEITSPLRLRLLLERPVRHARREGRRIPLRRRDHTPTDQHLQSDPRLLLGTLRGQGRGRGLRVRLSEPR
jgi:hypothetical protein